MNVITIKPNVEIEIHMNSKVGLRQTVPLKNYTGPIPNSFEEKTN